MLRSMKNSQGEELVPVSAPVVKVRQLYRHCGCTRSTALAVLAEIDSERNRVSDTQALFAAPPQGAP
ncbi:hypothetical protein MRX96_045205 [Rhipicephalus microplus]